MPLRISPTFTNKIEMHYIDLILYFTSLITLSADVRCALPFRDSKPVRAIMAHDQKCL
jgi:hypothetical protein